MADNKKYNIDGDEFSLESIMNEDFESEETFTLESILAEYKSKAYMAGEKKTPPEVLQKQTEEILREAAGRSFEGRTKKEPEPEAFEEKKAEPQKRRVTDFDDLKKRNAQEPPAPVKKDAVPSQKPETVHKPSGTHEKTEAPRALKAEDFFDEPAPAGEKPSEGHAGVPRPLDERPAEPHTEPVIVEEGADDDDLRFFESFKFADKNRSVHSAEIEETISRGEEAEEDEEIGESFFSRIFHRHRTEDAHPEEEPYEEYEEPEEEPDLQSEASKFAARVPSIRLRAAGAAVICILMLIMTHLFVKGTSIPFGIGTDAALTTGVLLIMELIVMLLGMDVLISGLTDIIRLAPGTESLVFISSLISVVDGFVMLLRGDFSNGLPFALVSAGSIFFSLYARKAYYIAMYSSLKASVASSSPYGVISEDDSIRDRAVLKKIPGATKGFYSRVTEADFGESAYNKAAPLFIVASFIFAFITSVGRGRGSDFAHTLSVMTALSAAFPAAAVFALPFKYAASCAKKASAAIAGWGGACDIYYSDGALLTDVDIYPVGSVSLSGLKLFEGVSQRKAIVYTSSLIIASRSGLAKVFEELLRSQSLTARRVNDFACYDGGGISAVIEGERVLVGTSAFMNLMGIRVPDSVNTKSSVFTAMNDELAAVFTINYVPANSVQSALVALLNTKTNILMAVRDFNVTPGMIQKKFKVSMEGVEYMPIETTYKLSCSDVPKGSGAAAVLCRGGLAPFAEVITRGRFLKQVTELNSIISVAGTAIGLLIMFFLCWTGSFASASAENAFVFMFAIEVCVLLLSQIVRKRL
ncbi:MAG: hypothetical protein ACI3VB_02905 [Oscillospiraceae bacterium]